MRAVEGSLGHSLKGRRKRGPRWTRAVEDQSVPIPEEVTSKLGGNIIETWSLDARSKGQPRPLPLTEV